MRTTTANKAAARYGLSGLSLRIILLGLLVVAASCANNEKDIPAPGAHIKMPATGFELEVGDTLRLSPRVSYEVDASYQWLLNNELLSTEKELLHQSRELGRLDRKSTRLNSSHVRISYAVFCLKKKKNKTKGI